MIFKCYLCKEYRFWNKNCYEVQVTGNDGSQELFKKKMCGSCGDGISEVYESGKAIAEMEVIDEEALIFVRL